ncbi:MAG: Parvulin-like protein peptidyl-prolyl isomerase [Candidatus Beckwithbacteria bacterium GW2011_GWA2_43_10]|uniref:Parvulin-like protein peptidyl-prolyl isomerase n=1 Tax=Candidatus Beckwithbacteria bacterium GW2011_GWA2_43_10 TaxID=1618369 RepID=A0A0G1EZ67_9BACT|nr:MAG: Parvulin-like protein peptidyl-prolyl isomerase [Candidatus Beckwithbacteria bacterium GW2011_GWA2_43_10]
MTAKKVKVNKKIVNKLKAFKWLAVGLALIGLVYYFKASFVVAIVNGKPIWKVSYSQEINRLAGKQALENLIIKTMILQEAEKQKTVVADSEINEEIKQAEEFSQQQGMSLDQLLELQGMKKEDLISTIKLNKLVEKMAGTESAKVQEWITNLQTNGKTVKWLNN